MTTELNEFISKIDLESANYTNNDIFKLTDLTLLDKTATESQVLTTYEQACTNKVAAICLYPKAFECLPNAHTINRATVVNFPAGNMLTSAVVNDIEQAITLYKIDEIDYVFSYQEYLNNEKNKALEACHSILEICKKYNKTLKVIIESGAFPSEDAIYDLSVLLAKQGCHFIKTSTGKTDKGATPEAAFAILNAIKDTCINCGVKVSGGIRTFEQANIYINLAEYVLGKKASPEWFRIGASRLS